MSGSSLLLLILIVVSALIFDYFNGVNDSANAVATCVSTRALSIRAAILMAALCNLIGALISTKVAMTIGQGIVKVDQINQLVIVSGLAGAIIWSFITWRTSLPSSSTHALVGGLIGSSIAHGGFGMVNAAGVKLILLALIIAPLAGLLLGFILEIMIVHLVQHGSPKHLNNIFRKLQAVSAAFVAFAHGTADAQKSMGIITMALFSYGAISQFTVPMTVIIACATVISTGTAIGGWRIIKTIGSNFVKMQPLDGLCVQVSASAVLLLASSLGLPSSTTHVITSAIVGSALTKRLSAVNWRVAVRILQAWLLTVPASATVAFLVHAVMHEIWRLTA